MAGGTAVGAGLGFLQSGKVLNAGVGAILGAALGVVGKRVYDGLNLGAALGVTKPPPAQTQFGQPVNQIVYLEGEKVLGPALAVPGAQEIYTTTFGEGVAVGEAIKQPFNPASYPPLAAAMIENPVLTAVTAPAILGSAIFQASYDAGKAFGDFLKQTGL